MAEYSWGDKEKAEITLGRPYLFTKKQYEYCKTRGAPIAVIYYDTKTSAASKDLYAAVFQKKDSVTALTDRLSEDGQYKGGYCCLFVLDRCGKIAGADEDLLYFINNVFKPGSGKKNIPFAILALSYGGKTVCQTLDAAAGADQLAQAIYQKGENGGGMGKFSQWNGREAWLDRQHMAPDPESKATGALNTEINSIEMPPFYENPTANGMKYENYDTGRNGDFNGIPRMDCRNNNAPYLLNLADISTPETTYCLIAAYDSDHKESCSRTVDQVFAPYMEKRCDNVVKIWNTEAHDKFKAEFEKGLKYRYFVFYEFSHGSRADDGVGSIGIGISYADIWNTFSSFNCYQKVWGLFDSCFSGNMIQHKDIPYQPLQAAAAFGAAKNEPEPEISQNASLSSDLLEYIDRKLTRRAVLMEAITQGQISREAAANSINPRMTLWCSTGPKSYGWYLPGAYTNFMKGFGVTMESVYWGSHKYHEIRYGWAEDAQDGRRPNDDTAGEYVFKKLQREASSSHGIYDKTLNTCVPRCRNYPAEDSFRNSIIFY